MYDWGYEQNPYDLYTFNKMISGEQLTMKFHVDDLKCFHLDQSVLDNLVGELNDVFHTSKKELAETKGNIHEYLGLTIDFSGKYNTSDPNKKGQVVFTMYDHIEDIINSAPPDMRGIAPDPARSKLFNVHKISPRLGTAETNEFHSMTARLMFAANKARPDILVAVVYLCTRVREPPKDDYLKLTRVIQYLHATVYLPLIIGWDKSGTLLWSIDASFAVYNNMTSDVNV